MSQKSQDMEAFEAFESFDTLVVGSRPAGHRAQPAPASSSTSNESPFSSPAEDPAFTPFTVIIDTREQSPWAFRGYHTTEARTINRQRVRIQRPLVVKTITATLQSGDYSIEGLTDRVAIERKSLSDLYGTLLSNRDRFKRELERLADESYRYSAVVVEAPWAMVVRNSEYEPAKIKSVVGSIMAFDQRFPTKWWFGSTRAEAERFAFRALERFWKDQGQGQEQEQNQGN